MKIDNASSLAASVSARRASAGAAAPGFAPATGEAPRIAAASAAAPAHSIEAMLALQGAGEAMERRARQARRGADALSALEDMASALLSGRAPAALRTRLQALMGASEDTGEAGLDAILLEIDTRLAVEIAKLEMSFA